MRIADVDVRIADAYILLSDADVLLFICSVRKAETSRASN